MSTCIEWCSVVDYHIYIPRYIKGDNSVVAAKSNGCFTGLGVNPKLLREERTNDSPGTLTLMDQGVTVVIKHMNPFTIKPTQGAEEDKANATCQWGYGMLKFDSKEDECMCIICTSDSATCEPDCFDLLLLEEVTAWQWHQ